MTFDFLFDPPVALADQDIMQVTVRDDLTAVALFQIHADGWQEEYGDRGG